MTKKPSFEKLCKVANHKGYWLENLYQRTPDWFQCHLRFKGTWESVVGFGTTPAEALADTIKEADRSYKKMYLKKIKGHPDNPWMPKDAVIRFESTKPKDTGKKKHRVRL